MHVTDVYKKESGKLWQRKPCPGSDGLVLTIVQSLSGSLPFQTRNVRFLSSVFDASGDRFLAADHHGNIYLFDMQSNRFTLVQKTGSACSALALGLHRRAEFLVAMSDYTLKCFDTDTKELVAMMKGHQSAIHSISVHSSGRYAITTSVDTAQLWDLDSFQRKRKLNIKDSVGIVKVFFLPLSNTIVTCFKDDTLFAWDLDTLQCKYQIHAPSSTDKSHLFKTFAPTKDGRILVGGGRSRFLHVWSIEGRSLLRVIELQRKITCVHHIDFLPDAFDTGSNQILGVLSQDGIVRFINIHDCTQLFEIGRLEDRVTSMSVSPLGHHVVTLMDSGNINVYSTQALSKEHNKPPAPLVKVLTSNETVSFASNTLNSTGSKSGNGSTGSRSRKGSYARSQSALSRSKEDSKLSELPEGVSMDRLMAILKGYGEYPAKYRMFIWRTILHLPENHEAYAALVEKGTHPSYAKLHKDYPVKSRKLLRVLQRVLSSLAHWSPIFGETEYLPLLTFPFVKLFQNNQLVCFEVISTVLMTWCQHWFEYFPNPPINILGLVENVLAFHDKELLQHFIKHHTNSQIYAWPLLETFFSEVLTRDEWLKLMDNIFSNHPSYLLMVAVAYCTVGRAALLHCKEQDDFKYYFHHRNAMNVNQLISEAYHLMDSTPDDLHPRHALDEFVPLTRGLYPVFNKYPKFIVDFQVVERERIRQQEDEYLQQTMLASTLRVESEKRLEDEKAWYNQQQLLTEAEKTRRALIVKEDVKLTDQRTRLSVMKREMKMKELQLLDATRRKFMTYAQQQKETELARLDDDIRRKVDLRATETQTAIDEVGIRNMELQVQKKLFEQELYRDHADLTGRHRAEVDAWRDQEQLRAHGQRAKQDDDHLHQQQRKTALLSQLSHTQQLKTDSSHRVETELRQRLNNSEVQRTSAVLDELQEQNRELEESIEQMIRNMNNNNLAEVKDQQNELSSLPPRSLSGASLRGRSQSELASLRDCSQSERASLRSHDQSGLASLRSQSEFSTESYGPESVTSDEGTILSLDRGRRTFEEREQQVMAEVRNVRSKLAAEKRTQNRPIPLYGLDK